MYCTLHTRERSRESRRHRPRLDRQRQTRPGQVTGPQVPREEEELTLPDYWLRFSTCRSWKGSETGSQGRGSYALHSMLNLSLALRCLSARNGPLAGVWVPPWGRLDFVVEAPIEQGFPLGQHSSLQQVIRLHNTLPENHWVRILEQLRQLNSDKTLARTSSGVGGTGSGGGGAGPASLPQDWHLSAGSRRQKSGPRSRTFPLRSWESVRPTLLWPRPSLVYHPKSLLTASCAPQPTTQPTTK